MDDGDAMQNVNESANIELVLASGVLNARYVVGTGFVPASDPPGLPVITVSGRMLGATR